jgi:hypothetical protein
MIAPESKPRSFCNSPAAHFVDSLAAFGITIIACACPPFDTGTASELNRAHQAGDANPRSEHHARITVAILKQLIGSICRIDLLASFIINLALGFECKLTKCYIVTNHTAELLPTCQAEFLGQNFLVTSQIHEVQDERAEAAVYWQAGQVRIRLARSNIWT